MCVCVYVGIALAQLLATQSKIFNMYNPLNIKCTLAHNLSPTKACQVLFWSHTEERRPQRFKQLTLLSWRGKKKALRVRSQTLDLSPLLFWGGFLISTWRNSSLNRMSFCSHFVTPKINLKGKRHLLWGIFAASFSFFPWSTCRPSESGTTDLAESNPKNVD